MLDLTCIYCYCRIHSQQPPPQQMDLKCLDQSSPGGVHPSADIHITDIALKAQLQLYSLQQVAGPCRQIKTVVQLKQSSHYSRFKVVKIIFGPVQFDSIYYV